MPRVSEQQLLLPTLQIIGRNPGCKTEFIIDELRRTVQFNLEDLEILSGRNDEKFTQIIRNLTGSHYATNALSSYTTRTQPGRHFCYFLNQVGEDIINQHDMDNLHDEIEENIEDTIVEDAQPIIDITTLVSLNNRVPELNPQSRTGRYKTNASLKKTAIQNANYICEYSYLFGDQHLTFDTRSGNQYLEGHHLIPMKAQADFGIKNLDRLENIVALCPICHAAVHYGTLEEKVRILRPLYNLRMALLHDCDHNIYISFEDLINNYYL